MARTSKKPKDPQGLKDEIAMLRSLMRRVAALADGGCETPDLLRVAETIGSAGTRLAALLKAERELSGSEVASALDQVLEEMIDEIRAARAEKPGVPAEMAGTSLSAPAA